MNSGIVLAGTDRIHQHDVGLAADARDRRDVSDEIEIELVEERRGDRVRRSDQQKRIAVCGRPHDRLGSDAVAASRPVLDDEWLAEPLRQPLAQQACEDVAGNAGGIGDHHAHRPRRIGLRQSEARHRRERGSARGQLQKLPARTFHGVVLWSQTCATHGLRRGHSASLSAADDSRCGHKRIMLLSDDLISNRKWVPPCS